MRSIIAAAMMSALCSYINLRAAPLTNADVPAGTITIVNSDGQRASRIPQQVTKLKWAVEIEANYTQIHDITYSTAGNFASKLDVYKPKASNDAPRPTLMYIHGGGWMEGVDKEWSTLTFLPFLQLGWTIVNVDYRPSSVSLAPAAVEDCLCALRWIGRNADKYAIDTAQLVLMGQSAGGHLALTTGMIPLSTSGLGAPCVAEDMYANGMRSPAASIRPRAIINWFGITDVLDIATDGPNQQAYAVRWLGNQLDRAALARSVSPLTYVRTGLPPVITIHGTKDWVVPYDHAVRLHAALTAAAVPNRLISVPEAGHNDFSTDVVLRAYAQVFDFLREAGIIIESE